MPRIGKGGGGKEGGGRDGGGKEDATASGPALADSAYETGRHSLEGRKKAKEVGDHRSDGTGDGKFSRLLHAKEASPAMASSAHKADKKKPRREGRERRMAVITA